MSQVLDQIWPVVLVARDWAALVLALVAALAALATRRTLLRQMRVFVDGQAEPISDRTRRVTLRIRNHTLKELRLRRISVLRPASAVLAMDGREARPGPIELNHVFPPMDRGMVVLLIGSRAPFNRPVTLKLRYTQGRRRWPAKTRLVRIELDTRLASIDGYESVQDRDLAGTDALAHRAAGQHRLSLRVNRMVQRKAIV